jgi:hypothetical protein
MAAPTIQLKRGSNAVPNALAGEPIIRYNGNITELHIGDSGGTSSELIASDAAYDANIEILTKSVASTSVGSLTLKDSQATQGTLTVEPNASTTDYTFVFPAGAGAEDDVLTVTSVAAGVVTMGFAAPSASSFDVVGDTGTVPFNTGEDLSFVGGDGITTVVAEAVAGTTTVTISADLKANGGIVIESTELAVDLGASAITGTLATSDGGTGLTSIAADSILYTSSANTLAATSITQFGRDLIDDADAATARGTLGLVIGTDVQAYDAGLNSIAGLTTAANNYIYTTASDTYTTGTITQFGRDLIDDADAATARGTLNVDVAGTDNSTDVTLVTTSHDYLSISTQAITLGAIDLTSDVTGVLPITDGGTGATTAAAAATALGVGTTSNPSFAGATAGNIQVGITGDNEIDTSSGNLTIDSADGTTTIDDNLIVSGNLTVSGTTTTVNTQTVTVEDRLFELGVVNGAAPSAETTWDLGVAFNYHDGTGAKRSALIWVDDTEGFSLVNELGTITNEAGTNAADPQIAITEFANLAVNSLFIGDLGTATNQVIDSSKNVINVTIDGGTY